MIKTTYSGLSSLIPVEYDLRLEGVSLKQRTQRYSSGLTLNFAAALADAASFKQKSNTNFYLTPKTELTSLLDAQKTQEVDIIPNDIFTLLNASEINPDYVQFCPAPEYWFKDELWLQNTFYGSSMFSSLSSEGDYFNIEFVSQNTCRVSVKNNNILYFLVVSDNPLVNGRREVMFVANNKITPNNALLEYTLWRVIDKDYISLLSRKSDGKYLIKPSTTLSSPVRQLVAEKMTGNEFDDKIIMQDSSFSLNTSVLKKDQSRYNPTNASFVEYGVDMNINNDKSRFDIDTNFLLSKVNNCGDAKIDVLCLKGICDSFDGFSSSNSLQTSVTDDVFVEGLRNYTSIFNDIPREFDENLQLNYVTYNTHYRVGKGTTLFQAPSSLNPYISLNINDTKFVECGAFAYPAPYFADRVYKLEQDVAEQQQQYLCTWLSGAPGGGGLWVDRYFYPDFISKREALTVLPTSLQTYEDVIEKLITNNSRISDDLGDVFYFDKKSDLTFEANKKYKYYRSHPENVEEVPFIEFCDLESLDQTKYFKDINSNGGFALKFRFSKEEFKVESSRSAIDGGILIEKRGDFLVFEFNLFDNKLNTNKIIRNDFSYKLNSRGGYIVFNFDTRLGRAALYLDDELLFSFSTYAYEYTSKSILFGNINVGYKDTVVDITKKNLLEGGIKEIQLFDRPLTTAEERNVVYISQFKYESDLIISLPCGMINKTDKIKLINVLDSNFTSKSNVVDINVNNINIKDTEITDGLRDTLISVLNAKTPATINIKDIKFNNYK